MNVEISEEESTQKNKYLITLFSMVLIFTFCLPNQIRIGMLGEKLGAVNYIGSLIILLIVLKFRRRLSKRYSIFIIVFSIYFLATSVFYQGVEKVIYSLTSYIIPMMLISLKLRTIEFEIIFKRFLKIFNIIIVLITVMAILNLVTGGKVNLVLAQFVSGRLAEIMAMQKYESVNRMYSFMGHPLFNTELYIIYYISNSFYNKYINRMVSPKILLIISIMGVAMTASKTGFVLMLIAMLLVNSKKFNLKYYVVIAIVIIIIFKSGIFDSTIVRFAEGGLTTGRTEKWQIVQHYNIYPLKFFTGYGLEFTFYYNSIIDWASAAFEYPFRMFALELGIINTICIYLAIGVYPIYTLIKRRHISLFLGYFIVFTDVNTYNGLSLKGDYMMIFCIFIFIILNLSNYLCKSNVKLIKKN